MARTICVTGGAGFIGSHLVDRLLGRGERVVVVDDFDDFYDPAEKRARLAQHAGHPALAVVEADIRDAAAMEAVFARHRPEIVVHLAARAGVRPSLAEPALYTDVNVTGTAVLLEAARTHGVRRFVFGSSSSVYGIATKVPFAEDAPLVHPASPYAASKIAGEALVRTFAHLYGLEAICLRFFTVYGPRQRPDLAIRKFAERILRDEPIELYGDGSSSRDYTYVDDIVDGVEAALDVPLGRVEIVNLGGARPVRLSELVERIEAVLGRKARIVRRGDQPGDVPRTFADVSRAAALLGYRPRVDLDTGLARFAAWLTARAGHETKPR